MQYYLYRHTWTYQGVEYVAWFVNTIKGVYPSYSNPFFYLYNATAPGIYPSYGGATGELIIAFNTNTTTSLSLLDKPIDTLEVKKARKNSALTMNHVKPEILIPVDNNPMNQSDVFIEVTDAKKPIASAIKAVINEKPRKKMHLEITEMSGERAYKDVKNRFSMAPDPDDSLFLARNYYKEGKYSKAAYWALQTNKLNGDIEESWLIFAKSKSKTGHKNEAIRVLSQYVAKSNSTEARKLLYKLKHK